MAIEIGTYEARTHWSELLQEVKNGKHYVITHRGEPVAELMPPRIDDKLQRAKQAAERLLGFMNTRKPVDVDIKALINEGRD